MAFFNNYLCLSEYSADLRALLEIKMNTFAPMLTGVVGPLVGARMISLAGSLSKLSMLPASTIQLLGAKNALFKAIRTKKSTPRYGVIQQAAQAAENKLKEYKKKKMDVPKELRKYEGKNISKLARILAAEAALTIRRDAFGDAEEYKKRKRQEDERVPLLMKPKKEARTSEAVPLKLVFKVLMSWGI